MAVSFIGGGNRSTRRKLPTYRKSLTNFITQCCIGYTSQWAGVELTTLVVIGTDCTGSCKSNYHTTTTTTATENKYSTKKNKFTVPRVWRISCTFLPEVENLNQLLMNNSLLGAGISEVRNLLPPNSNHHLPIQLPSLYLSLYLLFVNVC